MAVNGIGEAKPPLFTLGAKSLPKVVPAHVEAPASFEILKAVFKALFNASLFNEKDNMTSISSRIMMGTVIKGGTGMFDILLDTKKIENSEYIDEPIGRVSFPPLKIEPLINNILNNNDIHINFFIPTNI